MAVTELENVEKLPVVFILLPLAGSIGRLIGIILGYAVIVGGRMTLPGRPGPAERRKKEMKERDEHCSD